ncbi:MAG: glycosyltransferase family 4 protein, partial [Opitutae bacterium]|nr:glycosyltransferase family 4 protein [Opitutae bacterium]
LSGKHATRDASSEVVDGIPVCRSPRISQLRPRLIFNAIWMVWNVLVRAGRYDVVHIHNLSTIGALAAMAGRVRGTPVLMKLPNVGKLGIPGLCKNTFGNNVLHLLRSVSAFVAMAEDSVSELKEIGTPERKVFQMVNGINVERFDEKTVCEQAEAPQKQIKVIFTGRFVPQKGLDELLNAWGILHRDGKLNGALLQLVGEGPEEDSLRRMTRELEIGESVQFMGFRNDVPSLLKRASIFVLPSHVEGNSNSILEAMAAGLPIVATDVGGTSMQVGEVAADWIVAAHDVPSISRCLGEMLVSDELRLKMGALMRSRIEDHFDIRVVAEGYRSAYSALAQDIKADMRPLMSSAFRSES